MLIIYTTNNGKVFRDSMPATNAELPLPYNKLLANLVLKLYKPLHQLKHAQLDPT